ncbi:MAG: hypothetical protein HW386_920, partial [Gammaproteobacteria bacterium]|nr:hypothetical protein [Gammaproteobacteria bacterium]
GNGFWKLSTGLSSRSYDDAGQPLLFGSVNGNNAALGAAADYNGQGTLSLTAGSSGGDSFMYDRGTAAAAPFNADVDATFTANDLKDSDNVCYDPDDNDTCDPLTISGITGSGTGTAQQRFGRLNIGKEVSSTMIAVNVPLTAEYYNGTSYVVNTDDQCTGIASNELTLSNTNQSAETDGDIEICEAGGTTTMSVTNNPLVSGDGLLSFTAPGASCEGFTNILIDLSLLNLNHLRFDWEDEDGSNNGPYDQNPQGRATFGIISRPKEIIYTREPWN